MGGLELGLKGQPRSLRQGGAGQDSGGQQQRCSVPGARCGITLTVPFLLQAAGKAKWLGRAVKVGPGPQLCLVP